MLSSGPPVMFFPSLFHPLFSLDDTALFSFLPLPMAAGVRAARRAQRCFAGAATPSLSPFSPSDGFLLLLFCRREARTAAVEPDGHRRREKRVGRVRPPR
jgi:hypothetical protein